MRRPWTAIVLMLCALLSTSAAVALQVFDGDSIRHPPGQREFRSPSGAFVLVVSTTDNWQSPHATAELFGVQGATRTSIWRRPLPHEYGPRFALAGNRGDVLLLDEWINAQSRYAVMVINRRNEIVAEQSYDDVEKTVGVAMGRIQTNVRSGVWIGGTPSLDAASNRAVVPTVAAVALRVDLTDGRVSVSPGKTARP